VNPNQWVYVNIFNKPLGARTVLPIGQSILAGLIVFALLIGIALGFAFLSYNAGMGALVTLGIMALAFGYRSGMLAVLGAAFVALLPGVLAVGGVDDYRRAKRLSIIEAPVAELSYRQMADVFVLRDFRVATEFAHVRRTYGTVGGAPQAEYFGVAPIVPTSWNKGQQIIAWLGCTGSEQSWCQKVFTHPLRAATREDGRRFEAYWGSALVEAAQRHGLAIANPPLVLHHTEPPDARSGRALTGMIAMPILGFVLWLIGFLAWRAIKPAKAPAPVKG